MTLADMFPGNMGRVELTRVALRLRMPALMKLNPRERIDAALAERLGKALAEVRKG